MIEAKEAAQYLKQYTESYRREYQRFIAPPPEGGGYPDLQVSPYLYSRKLICFLAKDGAVVADCSSRQPSNGWEIAGGPALVVSTPESRTPPEIVELLKREGLWGKHIGLYRIVAQAGLANEVWNGQLPEPREAAEACVDETLLVVNRYDAAWSAIIERLTHGAFCNILDIHLPNQGSPFWNPHIFRDLGFATEDRQHKVFFHYLELLPHVEKEAWDTRSIRSRVFLDIHRDYMHTIGGDGEQRQGALLSLCDPEVPITRFYSHLLVLQEAITSFEDLLNQHGGENEAVFHDFLRANPVLLDVYGELISKPRFYYPEGKSLLDKAYVEPDFIVKYPNNTYKLVELEKPSKKIATKSGQPRAEVTQATFQIAEFKDYINNHYEEIVNEYPGISVSCSSMVVIGRASEESIGSGRDIRRYMEMVKQQSSVDEVLLYDDLLTRAKQVYVRLQNLAISR